MIRVGILTVSDRSSKGERPDTAGPALGDRVQQQGWEISHSIIVPDERASIEGKLVEWVDQENLDLILTTGGTGFAPRDVTPEATLAVSERLAPGIAEAMRTASLEVTPHAMLSRSVAVIRGKTLIINLPGSPKGALENLEVVLPVIPHAIELLQDDPDAEQSH